VDDVAAEDAVIFRIRRLISDGASLSAGTERAHVKSESHRQECAAWLTSAKNAVCLVCLDPGSPYREAVDRALGDGIFLRANRQVGEIAAILKSLLVDLEAGLLVSVADRARAEVVDDFPDQGEAYFNGGKKNEAGVIVGVVFEDAVRRICRKRGIHDSGQQLDELISRLTKDGVFTATKAKRARVAAHVRTKATHAQWDEFDIADVKASIDFRREVVATELGA